MPQTNKTFRVFISSTFSDLKEERNALQERVFPKLQDLCQQHGARFQAIDLRWGVSEEAGLDQLTMKICLDEIERCKKITPRPNFIVLLGDRYGWCPLPYEIPASEFKEIESILSLGTKESIKQLDLLEQWYCRDDNAVPPVYCLQPRKGESVHSETWAEIEAELRFILRQAVNLSSFSEEQRKKYFSSATEQEIEKGAFGNPEAKAHIFCFCRTINNLQFNETDRDFYDTDSDGNHDKSSFQALIKLKEKLKQEIPESNTFYYEANWLTEGVSKSHIDSLCADVYHSLKEVITEEIASMEQVDPIIKETIFHNDYYKILNEDFMGRHKELAAINTYLEGKSQNPLLIHGPSGIGKTALMAQTVNLAKTLNPDAVVIKRFIGVTPASKNEKELLLGLNKEIRVVLNKENMKIPEGFKEQTDWFKKTLEDLREQKDIVIIIDALDQLDGGINPFSLHWIPLELPDKVKVIVSTTTNHHTFDFFIKQTLQKDGFIEIKPLSVEDGNNLLDNWLKKEERTLQEFQREEVLKKFAYSGSPLYLKLCFEQVKKWKSLSTDIQLNPEITGIIKEMFERLSLPTNHGPVLIEKCLGYLLAAKNGLTEDELIEILSKDTEVLNDFLSRARHELQQQRLPVVLWSRLFFDLESYLAERNADGTILLSFYHRQVMEVAKNLYLDKAKEYHLKLACFYKNQPNYYGKDGKESANFRRLSELPYQFTKADLWRELDILLSDLDFIKAKIQEGLIYDLFRDYEDALTLGPSFESWSGRKRVGDFVGFIKKEGHILSKYPDMILQQAFNQPDNSTPREIALRLLTENPRPIFELEDREEHRDRRILTIPLGKGEVKSISWSPDGKRLCATIGKNLIIFDSYTGKEFASLEEQQQITDCQWSPDGIRIANSSGTEIKIWNSETNKIEKTLTGHTERINFIRWSPDGKQIASCDKDGNIKIWDFERSQEVQNIKAHLFNAYISWSPNGQEFISCSIGSLKVWDVKSGKIKEKYRSFVFGDTGEREYHYCSYSPDGTSIWVVNDSNISELKYSNLSRKRNRKSRIIGNLFSRISPNCEKVFSINANSRVIIWDTSCEKELLSLGTRSKIFYSCQWSPDGKRIATGTIDGLLEIWDGEINQDDNKVLPNIVSQKLSILERISVFLRLFRTLRYGTFKLDEIFRNGDWSSNLLIGSQSDAIKILPSLSPDGTKLIIALFNNLGFWDLTNDKKINTFLGYFGDLETLYWNPDGSLVAFASGDRVWVISTIDGKKVFTLHNESEVSDCTWREDGILLAVAYQNGLIKLWDVTSQTVHKIYPELFGKGLLKKIAWSPNSEKMALLLEGTYIKIVDVLGNVDKNLKVNRHINVIAWSPNNEILALGIVNGRIYLWNLITNQKTVLKGHLSKIKKMLWSPDGNFLFSLAADNTLRLWNVSTKNEEQKWVFSGNQNLFALGKKQSSLVIGDLSLARIDILHIKNLSFCPSLEVAVHCFDNSSKRWDESPTVYCRNCLKNFKVSVDKVSSNCPYCGEPIEIQILAIPEGIRLRKRKWIIKVLFKLKRILLW